MEFIVHNQSKLSTGKCLFLFVCQCKIQISSLGIPDGWMLTFCVWACVYPQTDIQTDRQIILRRYLVNHTPNAKDYPSGNTAVNDVRFSDAVGG
jgi:hypothetical protein